MCCKGKSEVNVSGAKVFITKVGTFVLACVATPFMVFLPIFAFYYIFIKNGKTIFSLKKD